MPEHKGAEIVRAFTEDIFFWIKYVGVPLSLLVSILYVWIRIIIDASKGRGEG